MPEVKSAPTFPRPLPVTVRRKGQDREFFFGFAVEGSPGGLWINTVNPKPIGFREKILFQLPGQKKKIQCIVEVVRSNEYDPKKCKTPGMELRFKNLDPMARKALEEFFKVRSLR